MARGLNEVRLLGNLVKDPEIKTTSGGKSFCSMRIAVPKGKSNSKDATFLVVVAWEGLAELCAKHLQKGSKAYMAGWMNVRTWQGKDGKTNYATEMVLEDLIMLGSIREGVMSAADQGGSEEDDPVPF